MMDGGAIKDDSTLPEPFVTLRTMAIMRAHLHDAEALGLGISRVFSLIETGEIDTELPKALLEVCSLRARLDQSRRKLTSASLPDAQHCDGHTLVDTKIRLAVLYQEIAKSEKILKEWADNKILEPSCSGWLLLLIIKLPHLFDCSVDILLTSLENDKIALLKELGINRIVKITDVFHYSKKENFNHQGMGLDHFTAKIENIQLAPPRMISVHAESDGQEKKNTDARQAHLFLSDSVRRLLINRNTLGRFGKEWTINALKNIQNFSNYENISSAQGRFLGQKAIIVGPGPSLKQDLNSLKQVARRCHVICVNHVLATLVEAGITPDIVIQTDSSYWPEPYARGFSGVHAFVFDLVSDPRMVGMASGVRLWPYVASDFKALVFSNALEVSEVPILWSAGTVSHSALSLAVYLGFDDILFVGHDYCYRDGKRYSNTPDLPVVFGESQRLTVKTNDGKSAFTEIDLEMFRESLEFMINKFLRDGKKIVLRTAAKSGAKIKNVRYISLGRFEKEIVSTNYKKIDWPSCNVFDSLRVPVEGVVTLPWIKASIEIIETFFLSCSETLAKEANEKFEQICGFAVTLSREYPELSLFLRKELDDIDELTATSGNQSCLLSLRFELCAALWAGLNLVKNYRTRQGAG